MPLSYLSNSKTVLKHTIIRRCLQPTTPTMYLHSHHLFCCPNYKYDPQVWVLKLVSQHQQTHISLHYSSLTFFLLLLHFPFGAFYQIQTDSKKSAQTLRGCYQVLAQISVFKKPDRSQIRTRHYTSFLFLK